MEKDMLGNKKIAIIGAGHIGQAIISGFIKSNKIKRSNILVSNKSNIATISKRADYIFITVKPFSVKEVLKEIAPFTKNKILLSVAAGVSSKMLLCYSDNDQKIIRLMPNIPVSENKGVIGFFPNINISDLEKDKVVRLVSLLGKVLIVKKEEDLDILTLIAGCGPAISAYFIKLISTYATKRGFSQSESMDMALKIFEGTTEYLKNNNLAPSKLIQSVATKSGITEMILGRLNAYKFDKYFEIAMKSGYRKIQILKENIKSETDNDRIKP